MTWGDEELMSVPALQWRTSESFKRGGGGWGGVGVIWLCKKTTASEEDWFGEE